MSRVFLPARYGLVQPDRSEQDADRCPCGWIGHARLRLFDPDHVPQVPDHHQVIPKIRVVAPATAPEGQRL